MPTDRSPSRAPFHLRAEGVASDMPPSEACACLVTLSRHLGVSLAASVNGVEVYACPDDDPDEMAKRWDPKAVIITVRSVIPRGSDAD